MTMDRRDFMKLAGAAGLAVAAPLNPARAQSSVLYDGTFFVLVNAGGGWDPTSLCDPKGRINDAEQDPMNESYRAADIAEAGNIRYAPVGFNPVFFEKYYQQLLILNGVDTQTNAHGTGSRNVWSGKLADGAPSFGALVAAVKARAAPMAYLSNGGYDVTGGHVAPTRSGNTSALARLAYPNRTDATSAESTLYHTDETALRIAERSQERIAALEQKQRLPRMKRAMNTLFTARSGESEIRRLTDFLPTTLDTSGNPLVRQAQIALASYRAGLSVSVNLSTGGFDTHGNHDVNHIPRLQTLLEGVDFVMEEAQRQGIADKVVVMVGSDFGRTPGYNDGAGKDHWPITSIMLMGQGITGNRVVGATDERHNPLKIDAATLQPSESGLSLRPEHLHRELRRLAGIDTDAVTALYPLPAEDLNLLSG